ncbi:MAG: phosphoribosylanthranilate isomerase [Candidatus Eremiobacteraeota bacterium]|nr:phosphoribosylanthranilate isomerase [Candidatus Eremiobacteraeota bacterium]
MRSRSDVALCVEAGADALGFIFAASPRRLRVATAAKIAALVPPFVTKVGVFGNNDEALVRDAIDRCGLDMLQFCGDESPGFCGSFGPPTIIRLHADRALATRDLRAARAVAVILDGADSGRLGGTGRRTPTEPARVARERSPLPLVLAGGLTPTNVGAAITSVRPWAVDVRSGVEARGRKSAQLVADFIRAAKGASL